MEELIKTEPKDDEIADWLVETSDNIQYFSYLNFTSSIEKKLTSEELAEHVKLEEGHPKVETEDYDDFTVEDVEFSKDQLIEEAGNMWNGDSDVSKMCAIGDVKNEVDEYENVKYKVETRDDENEVDLQSPKWENEDFVEENMEIGDINHKNNWTEYIKSLKDNITVDSNSFNLKVARKMKCSLCSFNTNNLTSLKLHMKRIHLKIKNYRCHLCDFSSSYRYSLISHIGSKHLKLKNHKCSSCDFSTYSKRNLARHVRNVHLNENGNRCQICDMEIGSLKSLEQHLKLVHLKVKTFKCELCDYDTVRKGNLKRHVIDIHSDIKRFECEHCDFKSSRKHSLFRHMVRIHLK
ncbi:hypothetical protein HHI36_020875 [Cryptolaemus montrouzieri]|uniref:C2H2-type domain-containing protein n=1 Tax=Cryptolaemus montrouzieri TaxID=559131 RepID=A0ABD2NBN0_9CUCU